MEDGTMPQTDEPTDVHIPPTTDEADGAVKGGLAYLAYIEWHLAP
jgi:hypothetical protein